MVYYLSAGSAGVESIDSATWDILDVPDDELNRRIEYAEPDEVHPSALQDNALRKEQGYWVKPETLPKKVLWAKGTTPTLPDALFGFAVSSRFKDLVEDYEPGVHQFVPVEIYHSRAGEPVATYYWFIVGQRLDSVDREHTTYILENGIRDVWVDSRMDTKSWTFEKIPEARLVFNNLQVAGHHIWHDPHVLSFNNGLCSDAFAEAFKANGLTGVAATPRESV